MRADSRSDATSRLNELGALNYDDVRRSTRKPIMKRRGNEPRMSGPTAAPDDRLELEKNAIRGLFGQLKSRVPGAVDHRAFRARKEPRANSFWVGLRQALISARSSLRPDQYDDYFEWLRAQINASKHFREFPAPVAALDGIFDATPVSADAEVHWAVARLVGLIDELRPVLKLTAALDDLVAAGGVGQALQIMDRLAEHLGASLWVYELGLALRQLDQGLEAQKLYSEQVRAPLRRAGYSFVVSYASVRNEPRTTWPRYRDNVADRVSTLALSDDFKTLIRYRLLGDNLETQDDVLGVLRGVQSFTAVDQYRTLLRVAEWCMEHQGCAELRQAFQTHLPRLVGLGDARLTFLVDSLGSQSKPHQKAPAACSRLLAGDLAGAYRMSLRDLKARPSDLGALLIVSICCAETGRSPPPWLGAQTAALAADLAAILGRSRDYGVAMSTARKVAQNLKGLNRFQQLAAVLELASGSPLNRTFRGVEALFGCRLDTLAQTAAAASGAGIACQLLEAMTLMRDGDLLSAKERLRTCAGSPSVVGAALGSYWLAHILPRTGERPEAIRLLAAEAARIPDASAWLPVRSVLPSLRWPDLKQIAGELAVSIVLDLSWRALGDDKIATLRRFAFNAFLKHNGIRRPSDLKGREEEFSRSELLYFLRNVCVVSVMDMSSYFGSSSEVDDEVLAIQEWLMSLDPARLDEYQARVFELNNRKVILEGLKLVDSSRLYVDVEAIEDWSRRDFGEDFSRYVSLVEAGIGVAADYDDMLRVIQAADHSQSFEVPENEADAILVDLTKALLREFLHSPEHGLDSYLSRRVRHHPLTATLRGPLESAGLITTKDTEFGAYKDNTAILARFPSLSDDGRRQLGEALSAFARTFDAILADLKEQRFHTRTVDHPNGLFQITLLPLHHYVIRSVVQLDRRFEDYLTSAFSVFWAILSVSLTEAQTLLNVRTRADIATAFDGLQARLQEIAGDQPAFAALAASCQDTAGEVQRKLSEVSDWFVRPEAAEAGRTFTLGQIIDIGVKSALDPYKDLTPKVSVTIEEDILLQAANVALLAEVLLVVLNNARQHGGIERGQVIDIRCTANLADQVIELCVSSQIDPAVRTPDAQRKIATLNKQIAAGNFERARVSKEGDSGLTKVAAVVYQSQKGSLTFGFEGEDRFVVLTLYSLIIQAKVS